LFTLLGIERGFHDPGVAEFGLRNVVMRIGTSYLEVVSPVQEGTTAGRYLQRRGGDSGYMVLVQVEDLAKEKARLGNMNVRIAWEVELGPASALHLHPGDVPGAIASMDEMRPPSTWHWAGEHGGAEDGDGEQGGGKQGAGAIPAAQYADAILAIEIESSDPEDTARKWAKAYDREIVEKEGTFVLAMDATEVRFVLATQDRIPGLCSVDIRVTDFDAVARQAQSLGLPMQDRSVYVCGTQLRFC
jgi:hypothetical protein